MKRKQIRNIGLVASIVMLLVANIDYFLNGSSIEVIGALNAGASGLLYNILSREPEYS